MNKGAQGSNIVSVIIPFSTQENKITKPLYRNPQGRIQNVLQLFCFGISVKYLPKLDQRIVSDRRLTVVKKRKVGLAIQYLISFVAFNV